MSKTTTMENYMDRDLNVGFSGGERKRCEAFQLLLQRPVLSMLDEPESGVDLQSVRVLGKALSHLQSRDVGGVRSATISKTASSLSRSHHAHGRNSGIYARLCGARDDRRPHRLHRRRARVLRHHLPRGLRVVSRRLSHVATSARSPAAVTAPPARSPRAS